MSFGIVVYNSTNNLVIDDTYKNMGLRQKTAFSLGGGGEQTITLTSAVNPLLFISASGSGVGVIQAGLSGSTYTWVIRAAGTSSGNVYIFDEPSAATSTYGVKVMNASGVQVFNSDNKYIRVVDVYNCFFSGGGSNTTSNVPTVSKTYPSSNYAVCIATPRAGFDGFNTGVIRTDAISTTSTGISISNTITKSFAGPWSTHTGLVTLAATSGNVTAMTIDVTGY
jgi:hypothetical protein